jgi:hypothetical protein
VTKLNRYLLFLALLALIVAAPLSPACLADAKFVFNTPPAALSGLTQGELNIFGTRLVTEAYEIRAEVGKPLGDPSDIQGEIDSDAVKAVQNLYDGDAMIQRARLNYALTKKTYVPNYTGKFKISNVAVSQTSETVLVMSFDVRLPERTSLQSGIVYSSEDAPRLLVMRWNETEKMWKIFSHGDFDSPRTYLCGWNKDFMPEKSDFKPEDVELARTLWDDVQTSSLTGKPQIMHSKGFQFVFASGERKTAPGKIRARLTKREEIVNLEAIRSGDLLVLRFDSIGPMTLDGGETSEALRPRLATFHHDPDGRWRMNAVAVFHVTAKFADNVSCVQQ